MQSMDFCENTIKLEPLKEKWKSFGWNVKEIDGHDLNQLKETLETIDINSDNAPSNTFLFPDNKIFIIIPSINRFVFHYSTVYFLLLISFIITTIPLTSIGT